MNFSYSAGSPRHGIVRGLRRWLGALTVLGAALGAAAAEKVTSLAELQRTAAESRTACSVELAATVWYADPANGRLILHDDSATTELRIEVNDPSLQPGDKVRLNGAAAVLRRGASLDLTPVAVVDNDGMHGDQSADGRVQLGAGQQPVRVDWFNATNSGDSRLVVEYEGPGVTRQPVPDAALSHRVRGDTPPVPGLAFRAYQERQWMLPPHRTAGALLREGVVPNFDCTVGEAREYVGAVFTGEIEVPAAGEYRFFLRSDDGARVFVGPPTLRLERLDGGTLPAGARFAPGQTLPERTEFLWGSVEGRVSRTTQIGHASFVSLDAGAGHVRVEVAVSAELPWAAMLNRQVRMTGAIRCERSLDEVPVAATLFVQDGRRVEVLGANDSAAANATAEAIAPLAGGVPPMLTTVERVERLERPRLDGRHLVRVRGVVTRTISSVQGIVLQDQTRGIYVNLTELTLGPVQTGERLEIVGRVEAGEFSPFIVARELTRLGAGVMPTPAIATREEMVNGSLHSQYVEIVGYVLAVDGKTVTLRSRAGLLRIEIETETAPEWVNAVVRMRGCLRVFWDAQTRQITVGKVGLDYAEVSIERAAPADLFDVASKRAAELLRFDPYAGAFQQLRLTGRVLQSDGNGLRLLDAGHGVRVSLRTPQRFARGDLVEVAGFPEFDGPSPHFADAVARKVGHADLPAASQLPLEDLLHDAYDSTLVSVDAELIATGFQEGRRTMQLHAGSSTFSARFESAPGEVPEYAAGSRLRLTGVYVGLGGNRALSRPVEAFELVLPSAAAVEVLSTPPWWTLPRLLTLVGVLGVGLLLAFLWITILRWRVAVQTKQLGDVLQERHRVQQEEALARERSRLAHELHDELGAGLSEIGLLGGLAASPVPAEKRENYLLRLGDTVRRLIASLDEIVWAVNPRYDTVASFVGYFTAYAQQYLELAALRCRLDLAEELPRDPLTSRGRHTLFLAFKEALTNVVKHAHATEVVIRIFTEHRQLVVAIADDGRGLPGAARQPGQDGLAGMRERLQQLGGECVVEPNGERGTRVSLKLPLP